MTNQSAQVSLSQALLDRCAQGVRRSIQLGANPNALDKEGFTPLGFCARIKGEGKIGIELMDALISEGADIEKFDRGQLTPLMRAARSGCIEHVKWLLEKGANPLAMHPNTEWTAAMYSLEEEDYEITILLIEAGGWSPSIPNSYEESLELIWEEKQGQDAGLDRRMEQAMARVKSRIQADQLDQDTQNITRASNRRL